MPTTIYTDNGAQQVRDDFRASFDPGDAWGCVMAAAFAACGEAYTRGIGGDILQAYRYRPGVRPLANDDQGAACARLTDADLLEWLRVILRYSDKLRAAGRDY